MTKFIVIASSKGGVGKTTTAINLGTALTSFGRDVIVVDANLSAPNVSLYLGAPSIPITLQDVIHKGKKITDAIYMHSHGLKIIAASQSMKDMREVDFEKLERLLRSLAGTCDFVIIDTAAGLAEEAINGMKLGDEIIVVSTPQLPAVTDALRTIKKAIEHKKKVSGIILTRVFDDELELSKDAIEAMLETPVIGIIPEDDSIRESVQIKNPVTYTHPHAPASQGYKKLAAKLIGEKYVESIEKNDTMFEFMMKKLGMK
jgi:septum site-determining protein MinD